MTVRVSIIPINTANGKIGEYGHKKTITIEGDTLLVELTQGFTMICDNILETCLLLQQHNFYALNQWNDFYAYTVTNNESFAFHGLIMSRPKDRLMTLIEILWIIYKLLIKL